MRKFSARIGLGLALMGLASPVLSATPEETARAALSRSPIIDGHNDVPEQLRARYGNDFSKFDFHDMSPTAAQKGGKMHTDLARLKKGMVGGQFWSVWVTTGQSESEAVREVTEQIDVVERLMAAYPKDLMLAKRADDIELAFRQHRIASLIGVEGGHSIGSSLGVLRQLYRAGARYMTITHSKNTPWADSDGRAQERRTCAIRRRSRQGNEPARHACRYQSCFGKDDDGCAQCHLCAFDLQPFRRPCN